jgi:hypothetical protein
MNEATAKRWIEQMPVSDEEKTKAIESVKGQTEGKIRSILNRLKAKSGGKFHMNKLSKPMSIK